MRLKTQSGVMLVHADLLMLFCFTVSENVQLDVRTNSSFRDMFTSLRDRQKTVSSVQVDLSKMLCFIKVEPSMHKDETREEVGSGQI